MNSNFYSQYPSNSYFTTSTMTPSYYTNSGDRFIAGGFLAPFLLGGLAGAALAPSFRPQQPMWWGQPMMRPWCCYW